MITSIFSLLGAFIILAYIYFDTYTVFFEFTLKFNHGYTKKGVDASVDYILMAILILVLQSYVFSINLQRANLRVADEKAIGATCCFAVQNYPVTQKAIWKVYLDRYTKR